MTSTFHLAQYNIARFHKPLDDPANADFVARLDEINRLAETCPGFVWRFQDESGNSTAIDPYGDPLVIVNFSVWESREALHDYTLRTAHVELMRRRREWFERHAEPYHACWWIPAGTIPTVEQAVERLAHLREHGPSPHAFGWRDDVAPPTVGAA